MSDNPVPRFPRALSIIFFGPLVGGFAAFLMFMAMNNGNSPPPPGELVQAVITLLLITVVTGWVVGLPAAVISAVLWHFLEPKLGLSARVIAALLIGAGTSMATSLPITYAVFGQIFMTLNGYVVVALIGAFAMAVTALPRRKAA